MLQEISLKKNSSEVSSPRPNLIAYSGHDSNVAAVLQAVGVYNCVKPPFTSALILELHNIDGQPVTQVSTII